MWVILKSVKTVTSVRVSLLVTMTVRINLKTIIGNNVFVGSDTQLVAPVTVADGATIGAGSTITQNIEKDELVITRVPQRHIQGWQRPVKKK